ncbi:MAG: thioesterase [Treponemataceae bacterium]|nr:MAG: thioesterase [Treponemataceae bacterium]
MDNKYTMNVTVSASDIDGGCAASLLYLAGLTQNLASFHYGTGGVSIPHLLQKNMTWIIAKQRFEITEYPLWLDDISGTTWAKPIRGLFCGRDFLFSYRNGGKKASVNAAICLSDKKIAQSAEPFMRGATCWIVLDTNTGRPVKPPPDVFGTLPFCDEDALASGSDFPRFNFPRDNDAARTEALFFPSALDIDMNDHVNNLNYVKWILMYTPLSIFREKLVSALDTYFVTSAKFGDELICATEVSVDDPGGISECLHSIVRASDGAEVFRARSRWLPRNQMTRTLTVD